MVPLKRDMLGCIIFGWVYMKCIILLYIGLVIFRVLFVWGGLVCVHENREPLDLLGPWVPYSLVVFYDLFLFWSSAILRIA